MLQAAGTGVHPLLQAVRDLSPRIRAVTDRIEAERKLPPWLVTAMSEAGVFRMLLPATLGGGEIDPVTQIDVVEELSWADGAVGWCAMIGSGSAWGLAFMDPAAAGEILADPTAILAGSFALPSGGRAVTTDGGYRVTGRWPFASGSPHATWMVAHATVFDGDRPRTGPDGGPVTRVMVFLKAEATIHDTWDTLGLRGTGSHDYAVTNLFVPAVRTFALAGEPPRHPGPLFTGRFFLLAHAAQALGVARAAVDAFRELATDKRVTGAGAGQAALVRERPTIQAAVAQAEALVRSGRAYLRQTTREIWDELQGGGTLSLEQRALIRLANSSAFEQSMRAVDLMYAAGGGTSVYRSCPLERYFRDIHTASQHSIVAPASFEAIGQALLAGATRDASTGRPLF